MKACYNITRTWVDVDSARGGCEVEKFVDTGFYHSNNGVYEVVEKILKDIMSEADLVDLGITFPLDMDNIVRVSREAYAFDIDFTENTLFFQWEEDDYTTWSIELLKPFKFAE